MWLTYRWARRRLGRCNLYWFNACCLRSRLFYLYFLGSRRFLILLYWLLILLHFIGSALSYFRRKEILEAASHLHLSCDLSLNLVLILFSLLANNLINNFLLSSSLLLDFLLLSVCRWCGRHLSQTAVCYILLRRCHLLNLFDLILSAFKNSPRHFILIAGLRRLLVRY